MPGHDIIVVGASAGGVEALIRLARGLPPNLPAAVFVVLHIPAESPSMLPDILNHSGPLRAVQPADGETIQHGHMYVAPPDRHLLVERGRVRVVRGPRENRHRPAVDPLFRTAARAYGPRVVGVILTGSLDDGTAGLMVVKQRGGLAVVQDPREALYPSMPRSAMANVEVDYCQPLADIPPLLARLVDKPAQAEREDQVADQIDQENRIVEMDMGAHFSDEHPGTPSAFSCPECGGVLWELQDSDLLRFRCRVGHAYTAESVLVGQSDTLEDALWAALKTLEESASLARRLARNAHARGHDLVASRYEEKVRDAEERAALLQQVLTRSESLVPSASDDQAAAVKQINSQPTAPVAK